MHLASVMIDGEERLAFQLAEDRVVDVSAAALALGPAHAALVPLHRMIDLIDGGEQLRFQLERLVEQARARPKGVPAHEAGDVRWLPPVPRPGKIITVPLNGRGVDSRKPSAPEHPRFFLKPPSCLIGHGEPIVLRPAHGSVHPGPALAVVIGRRARDVDPREALGFVYGFTILDDVTGSTMRAEDRVHHDAPDPAAEESCTARSRGSDGFGPCGPWLVTRESVPDPAALEVRCHVGGELVVGYSTASFAFRIEEVIAWVSRFLTLEPGDVISPGTVFGATAVAHRSQHPADLQLSDGPVEISITGLGTLSNLVRREDPPLPPWRLPTG